MVVQYSIQIGLPIETVSSALSADPGRWFPPSKDRSNAAVDPRAAAIEAWSEVGVEVGEPVSLGSWTEVPVIWHASHIKQLHPVMTGKVEVEPVSDRVTRLTVCADYEHPLGRLGEQLDGELLHGVAQATVTQLAESIALLLEGNIL